jgi:hypothetical protein
MGPFQSGSGSETAGPSRASGSHCYRLMIHTVPPRRRRRSPAASRARGFDAGLQNREADVAHRLVGSTPAPLRSRKSCKRAIYGRPCRLLGGLPPGRFGKPTHARNAALPEHDLEGGIAALGDLLQHELEPATAHTASRTWTWPTNQAASQPRARLARFASPSCRCRGTRRSPGTRSSRRRVGAPPGRRD